MAGSHYHQITTKYGTSWSDTGTTIRPLPKKAVQALINIDKTTYAPDREVLKTSSRIERDLNSTALQNLNDPWWLRLRSYKYPNVNLHVTEMEGFGWRTIYHVWRESVRYAFITYLPEFWRWMEVFAGSTTKATRCTKRLRSYRENELTYGWLEVGSKESATGEVVTGVTINFQGTAAPTLRICHNTSG